MIVQSNKGKPFSPEQAIDLIVSFSGTDVNLEKRCKGFFNSLSKTELQNELDDYWKD